MTETKGRTFLKSTSHVRVRDTRGNYLRSVAVGLQFGILHTPGEIVSKALAPLVVNLFTLVYEFLEVIFHIIVNAVVTIVAGFDGYLEASYEEVVYEDEDEGDK